MPDLSESSADADEFAKSAQTILQR
jgi:hypothetical protein